MRYFKISEFASKCGCGKAEMQDSTLELLDEARRIAGVPFVVNSGYRCEAHNKNVGGVPDSSHTKGYAVDIAVTPETMVTIYKALKTVFNRIGVAQSFIHADNDPSKPSPAQWEYK